MTSGYFELKNEIAALKARRSREKEAMQEYLLKIIERNKRVEEFAFSVSQKIDNMDRKADEMLIELEALRLPHTSSNCFTASSQYATESYSRLDKENEFAPHYSKYPDFPYHESLKNQFSSDSMYERYISMPTTTRVPSYNNIQIFSPYETQRLREKNVFPTYELDKVQQMGQSNEREMLSSRYSNAASIPGLSAGVLSQQEEMSNMSTLPYFSHLKESSHTEMPYHRNNPQILSEAKVVEPLVSSGEQYVKEKVPTSPFIHGESQELDNLSHNVQEIYASKSIEGFEKLSSATEPMVQAKKVVFVSKDTSHMTKTDNKNVGDELTHVITGNSVDIPITQEQENIPQVLNTEETTKNVPNLVVEMSLSQHPNEYNSHDVKIDVASKNRSQENVSEANLQLNTQETSQSDSMSMNQNEDIASDTSLSSREKGEIILQNVNEDNESELVLQQINEKESNTILQAQKDGNVHDNVQISEKAHKAISPNQKEKDIAKSSSQQSSTKTDNAVLKVRNQNDDMVLQLQKGGKENDGVQISETKSKAISFNQKEKKNAKSSFQQKSKKIDNAILKKRAQNDDDVDVLPHKGVEIEDRSFIESPVGDKGGKDAPKVSVRTGPESSSEVDNKITDNSAKISAAKGEILMDKKGKSKARRKSKTRKRSVSKKNMLLEESSETDDSFFDRGLPLTSSAAYQSLIGAAPITPKAPLREIISESESEDDVEKALAMAMQKGSSATNIENSPKKTQSLTDKPAVTEAKPASAQQRKSSLLPTSAAKMKLSKASRMALGLDSESDVPPIQSSIKKNVEEESDEFDFFN